MSTNASKLSLLAPNVNTSGTVEATTLDGLDSSQFLRSDAPVTVNSGLMLDGLGGSYTGAIGFNRNTTNGSIYNNSIAAYQIHNTSGNIEWQRYNSAGVFQGYPFYIRGSDGALGLGTNSPDSMMHLVTNADASIFRLSDATLGKTYGGYVKGWGVAGSGGRMTLGVVDGNVYNQAITISEQAKYINFWTFNGTNGSPSQKAILNYNGDFGLGTTSPTLSSGRGLHIASASGHTNIKLDNVNDWELLSTTSGYFSVYDTTAGADRLSIKNSSGNIGAGTTNPQSSLEVFRNDTPGPTFALSNAATGGRYYQLFAHSNSNDIPGAFGIYDGSSGGGYRLVLNSSGNVAIGTTNATARLEVQNSSGYTAYSGGSYYFNKLQRVGFETTWILDIPLSFTSGTQYYFHLVFPGSVAQSFDFELSTSRDAGFMYGVSKFDAYVYAESDHDFQHIAVGSVTNINGYTYYPLINGQPTRIGTLNWNDTSQTASNYTFNVIRIPMVFNNTISGQSCKIIVRTRGGNFDGLIGGLV